MYNIYMPIAPLIRGVLIVSCKELWLRFQLFGCEHGENKTNRQVSSFRRCVFTGLLLSVQAAHARAASESQGRSLCLRWAVMSVSLVLAALERFGRPCSFRASCLVRRAGARDGARLGCSLYVASVHLARSIYLLCCRAAPLLVFCEAGSTHARSQLRRFVKLYITTHYVSGCEFCQGVLSPSPHLLA